MFKNILKSEFKVGERIYHFLCDSDSPTNEVKEVCFHILKYCGQIEDAIKAKQEEEQKTEVQEELITE